MTEPDANGWRPIATAPRDGSPFLAWPFWPDYHDPEVVIGFYATDEDAFWAESHVAKEFEPTHWQPLPAPPINEEINK